MSEVPEDEALMRLQLQPEGDLFTCCDGTEEISQSSSNDTPAPERTVCQPCSTGSQLVPPTRGDVTSEEEEDDEEVILSEVGEGQSEEDESQEEVLEDEEQEGAKQEDVADSDSINEAKESQEQEGDVVEQEVMKSHTISGKLMADAAPLDKSKALADTKIAEEPGVAQAKESVEVEKVVEEPGEEALTDPAAKEKQPLAKDSESEEPARKSSVKGAPV